MQKVHTTVIDETVGPYTDYAWMSFQRAIQNLADDWLPAGARIQELHRQPDGDFRVVYTLHEDAATIGTAPVRQHDAG